MEDSILYPGRDVHDRYNFWNGVDDDFGLQFAPTNITQVNQLDPGEDKLHWYAYDNNRDIPCPVEAFSKYPCGDNFETSMMNPSQPVQQLGKMWSGRFREPLDKEFEAWQRSIVFDWRLLPQEVAASKAHASALCAAKILTVVLASSGSSATSAMSGMPSSP